jgi:hypothetical protein
MSQEGGRDLSMGNPAGTSLGDSPAVCTASGLWSPGFTQVGVRMGHGV